MGVSSKLNNDGKTRKRIIKSKNLLLGMLRKNWSNHEETQKTSRETLTSFRVLTNLLQANNNYSSLKKKIQVRQIIDDHTKNQIKNHEEWVEKLKKTRQQHDQFQRQKEMAKTQKYSYLSNLKVKNHATRTQHESRLLDVQKQIENGKYNEYLNICEQRKSIEKKIERNKENDLFQKKKCRREIIENEKKGKVHCERFLNEKCEQIHQQNVQEISKMNDQISQREKEREKLQKYEMEIMARQSQSQAYFKEMKGQMNSLLGKVQVTKSPRKREGKANGYRDSTCVVNQNKYR